MKKQNFHDSTKFTEHEWLLEFHAGIEIVHGFCEIAQETGVRDGSEQRPSKDL